MGQNMFNVERVESSPHVAPEPTPPLPDPVPKLGRLEQLTATVGVCEDIENAAITVPGFLSFAAAGAARVWVQYGTGESRGRRPSEAALL
jgi:hypothetical protein